MKSYFHHLTETADQHGVRLLDAFIHAGVNTSVYYRTRQGSDLSYQNALRVHDSIIELAEKHIEDHAAAPEEAHELADNHA